MTYSGSWEKVSSEHPELLFDNVIELKGRIPFSYNPDKECKGVPSTWCVTFSSQYGAEKDLIVTLINYIYEKGNDLRVTTEISYLDFLKAIANIRSEGFPHLKRRADQMFGFSKRTEDIYLERTLAIRAGQQTPAEAKLQDEV